ncbi:Peptidyl-tRNA hydrolase [hydrothermal vent metagenome]|uniref:peptidyl-tRNA hydrolase n=1 Tax=hydrothermal vent metagenome TaxID=652676 RepID=A0A1W1CT23_9ZZZZ
MLLIVGLGNPGTQYENTRHNIGFRVIDNLVNDFGARDVSKSSFQGKLFKSSNILFLKPTTFMNLSGNSVQIVKNFYKIELEDIIVIHDDIDLPFSALRFKKGGGHGGHNGLRSIDLMIGKEYNRVRMGVGKPEHKSQVVDYVLHDFSAEEEKLLPAWITHTATAIKELHSKTLNEVRSRYSLKSFEA